MADAMPNVPPRGPCVNSPRLNAQFARDKNNGRNFEMKTGLLQLLYQNPFTGLDHEDPFTHLTKFYEIARTISAPAAEEEQNELEEKFLDRLFPHNRFMEAKTSISVFSQGHNEALNEAWERFKSMVQKCKGHGFDELTQIHIFRNGLQPQPKTLLDATTIGSLMSKSVEEAIAIIDRMALNDHQGKYNRSTSQRKPGVLELSTSDAILSQNKLLTQQVELLTQQMTKLHQQLKEIHGIPTKNQQCLINLEACDEINPFEAQIEELKDEPEVEEPKVELKVLPSHLKYVFLEKNENKPVIIGNALSKGEEEKLLMVLERNQKAMGWTISDLKGISPSFVCIRF
ncbi:uncharacterized protein LOC131632709 [Vicia villosa]|uniref:uncharacterized protein LOC131632709 n=1 Tax=Vicia villosa TaxID=3911 RepID=UPI00273B3460|nr:uncharacterized protein LOC131632709 [Vicia villosa]